MANRVRGEHAADVRFLHAHRLQTLSPLARETQSCTAITIRELEGEAVKHSLPEKIYIVHDGSGIGGEPYMRKLDAEEMAQELTEQEDTAWYVATYRLVPSSLEEPK